MTLQHLPGQAGGVVGFADFLRRHALLLVFLLAICSLAAALYLQHALDWQPCPLCVLQRLAYIAVAVFALLGWLWRGAVAQSDPDQKAGSGRWVRTFQVLTMLAAFSGAAIAGRHLWVKAHPAVSCGIDPLETAINAQWWVQQMPWLLKADGLCFLPLPPLLGLQLPTWSLMVLLLSAVLAALQKVPSGRLS